MTDLKSGNFKLRDRTLLFACALGTAALGVGAFALAERFHVKPAWVFGCIVSLGFFLPVIRDFRGNFRSIPFALFSVAWAILHGIVFVVVMTYWGWVQWFVALVVELFLFHVLIDWLFGLKAPGEKSS